MNTSIIIPVRNAGTWIRRQLDALLNQTVKTEIIVVDSSSQDNTPDILNEYAGRITQLRIPAKEYDHGGTRDMALRHSTGDFVVFLTQDAIPAADDCIERLISVFSDERIAAVFGRQIAYADASEYERLIRLFNYPAESRVWGEEDISKYGVKSYFFSNCCSAYRRTAYEAVGGFEHPIETNEDMMIAAAFLHAGWKLAYQPEAVVYHSHRMPLEEEYRRNFRIGKVMEQYRERLIGADSEGEGTQMVRYVSGQLIKEKQPAQLAAFLVHAAVRWFGYRKGKRTAKKERHV